MKNYISIFIIILLISCEDKKANINWTKDGNLHQASIQEWKNADENNKLATCADFVANLKSKNNQQYNSVEEMKIDAVEMKICIETVIDGGNANTMKISEIAVLCHIVGDAQK